MTQIRKVLVAIACALIMTAETASAQPAGGSSIVASIRNKCEAQGKVLLAEPGTEVTADSLDNFISKLVTDRSRSDLQGILERVAKANYADSHKAFFQCVLTERMTMLDGTAAVTGANAESASAPPNTPRAVVLTPVDTLSTSDAIASISKKCARQASLVLASGRGDAEFLHDLIAREVAMGYSKEARTFFVKQLQEGRSRDGDILYEQFLPCVFAERLAMIDRALAAENGGPTPLPAVPTPTPPSPGPNPGNGATQTRGWEPQLIILHLDGVASQAKCLKLERVTSPLPKERAHDVLADPDYFAKNEQFVGREAIALVNLCNETLTLGGVACSDITMLSEGSTNPRMGGPQGSWFSGQQAGMFPRKVWPTIGPRLALFLGWDEQSRPLKDPQVTRMVLVAVGAWRESDIYPGRKMTPAAEQLARRVSGIDHTQFERDDPIPDQPQMMSNPVEWSDYKKGRVVNCVKTGWDQMWSNIP